MNTSKLAGAMLLLANLCYAQKVKIIALKTGDKFKFELKGDTKTVIRIYPKKGVVYNSAQQLNFLSSIGFYKPNRKVILIDKLINKL